MTIQFGIVCLCLAVGAVALNGESMNGVDPINDRPDYSCDQNGYLQYLSKWSVEEKGTSRDVNSEEFKTRLEYFIDSCEKIHEWNERNRYKMEFTFYADWHMDEFEELTTSKQRYSGVITPVPSIVPIYNNTNYRHLMPSMDRCDGNAELRATVSKPQNCSVSWAFAITNSIEYAIKKMYLEEYGQKIEMSLSAQELIDCVGKEHGMNGKMCDGMPLVWGFDYIYENGIAFSEFYPHTNVEGECLKIEDEHKYHIAGYEKPAAYNRLGLFDLMMRGPVAVTLGLNPEFFQYYSSDRAKGPFFNTDYRRPTVSGVLIEYSQYVANGDSTFVSNPFFAVETRLRACDSMVFRMPILNMDEDANMAGIAGFAIRPIVVDPIPAKPTTPAPTTIPPTTFPPIDTVVVPSELVPNPTTVETITLSDDFCSQYNSTQIILKGLHHLKSIVIGDNGFNCTRLLHLEGLYSLESIVIGKNSFTVAQNWNELLENNRSDGELRIVNCPKLKSIKIGNTSFYDYHSMVLEDLPSLQSIQIGQYCFLDAPSFSLKDLPTLQFVQMFTDAFSYVHSIAFENLPQLQTILLDRSALNGDQRSDRKAISKKPYNYKNTLTLRNLPELTRIRGKGYVFQYIGSVYLENLPLLQVSGIEFDYGCFLYTYSLQALSTYVVLASLFDATTLETAIRNKSSYV